MGIRNPYVEEQTTQWPKEKGQSISNDLKKYTENQRSSNMNPTKNRELTKVISHE